MQGRNWDMQPLTPPAAFQWQVHILGDGVGEMGYGGGVWGWSVWVAVIATGCAWYQKPVHSLILTFQLFSLVLKVKSMHPAQIPGI